MSEGPTKGTGAQSRKLAGVTRRPSQHSGTPTHSCQLGLWLPGFHTRERNPVKARPSQQQDTHTSVMLLCGHRHMLTKERLFKCKSLHGETGAGGRSWEAT